MASADQVHLQRMPGLKSQSLDAPNSLRQICSPWYNPTCRKIRYYSYVDPLYLNLFIWRSLCVRRPTLSTFPKSTTSHHGDDLPTEKPPPIAIIVSGETCPGGHGPTLLPLRIIRNPLGTGLVHYGRRYSSVNTDRCDMSPAVGGVEASPRGR